MTRQKAKDHWLNRGVHCHVCGKLVWRNWRGVLQMHHRDVPADGRYTITEICPGGVPAIDPQFDPTVFRFMPTIAPQYVHIDWAIERSLRGHRELGVMFDDANFRVDR